MEEKDKHNFDMAAKNQSNINEIPSLLTIQAIIASCLFQKNSVFILFNVKVIACKFEV